MIIPRIIDGRLKCVEAEPTVWNAGVGYNSSGSLCIFFGTPPDGGIANGGPLLTHSGRVCVSSNAIVDGAGGIPLDSSGRMVVAEFGVLSTNAGNGLPTTSSGAVAIDSSSFTALFADSGAGVVSTVLAEGGVAATFTRATAATTVLSSGLIGTVASGSARSYYDPTSLAYLGYLAEGARTTLILRSEEFGNAAWTASAASVSSDAGVAPDGATTADKLVEDTANAIHNITQSVTGVSGTAYTFSVFVKAAGRTFIELLIPTAIFGATKGAYFNLTTGAVGTLINAPAATSIKAYPNGWYRVSVSDTATASAAGTPTIRIGSADGTDSYLGDGSSGLLLWGAGFENGIFPSSYIPTTVATVTRNADVLSYGAVLSATLGSAFAQFQTLTSASHEASVICGGDNNGRVIYQANAPTDYRIQDTAISAVIAGNSSFTAQRKVASAWSSAGVAISESGSAVTSSAGVTSLTVDDLQIGHRDGAANLFGTISSTRAFPRRHADAVITRMST